MGFLELLESSESEAEVRTDLEEKKAKQAENLKNFSDSKIAFIFKTIKLISFSFFFCDI